MYRCSVLDVSWIACWLYIELGESKSSSASSKSCTISAVSPFGCSAAVLLFSEVGCRESLLRLSWIVDTSATMSDSVFTAESTGCLAAASPASSLAVVNIYEVSITLAATTGPFTLHCALRLLSVHSCTEHPR